LKKVLLYIIFVVLALDTTSLYQVFKLPSLFGHFTEHKLRNRNIDFIEFLAMHYWGEDLNDDDDEKDMQLPFKKIDLQQSAFLFVPTENFFFATTINWPQAHDYGIDHSQFHISKHTGAHFRPPQV
jgi:hypothetical protein